MEGEGDEEGKDPPRGAPVKGAPKSKQVRLGPEELAMKLSHLELRPRTEPGTWRLGGPRPTSARHSSLGMLVRAGSPTASESSRGAGVAGRSPGRECQCEGRGPGGSLAHTPSPSPPKPLESSRARG